LVLSHHQDEGRKSLRPAALCYELVLLVDRSLRRYDAFFPFLPGSQLSVLLRSRPGLNLGCPEQ
jgi:hypothetical protein